MHIIMVHFYRKSTVNSLISACGERGFQDHFCMFISHENTFYCWIAFWGCFLPFRILKCNICHIKKEWKPVPGFRKYQEISKFLFLIVSPPYDVNNKKFGKKFWIDCHNWLKMCKNLHIELLKTRFGENIKKP